MSHDNRLPQSVLERLAALAAKATPGPWTFLPPHRDMHAGEIRRHGPIRLEFSNPTTKALVASRWGICTLSALHYGNPRHDPDHAGYDAAVDSHHADGAYIAACSPDVVRALIQELMALRAAQGYRDSEEF